MVDYLSLLPDAGPRGRPLPTAGNLAEIFRRVGAVARFNTATWVAELLIPGARHGAYVEASDPVARAWLENECGKFGMSARPLRKFILLLADQNKYTPLDYDRYHPGDPMRRFLQTHFDWTSPADTWTWMPVTEALLKAGHPPPVKADVVRAGKLIRIMNGRRHRRDHGGRRVVRMPPVIDAAARSS